MVEMTYQDRVVSCRPPAAQTVLFKNYQLLIVEDQPLISIMMEEMATALGWAIRASVHNREDALKALDRCVPTLAILDIDLGTTTSLDVASRCRTLGVPVVFTTGYSDDQIPAECGDAPILAKPFSEAEFADALRHGIVAQPEHK